MPRRIDETRSAAVGPVSHAIFRVARLHKELAARLLRDIGLYPGQELLLMQLWDGGPQRQVDVLRLLGSDAATMTRSVQRLERAGLVCRTPNASDGRSVIIAATPASEALREKVREVWQTLEEAAAAGLSAGEAEETLRVLRRLEENLVALCAAAERPRPGE